jgi:hypothetical protein
MPIEEEIYPRRRRVHYAGDNYSRPICLVESEMMDELWEAMVEHDYDPIDPKTMNQHEMRIRAIKYTAALLKRKAEKATTKEENDNLADAYDEVMRLLPKEERS